MCIFLLCWISLEITILHYSKKGARYHFGRLTVTKSAWQQQTPLEPEENCEKFLKEISIKMCRSCSASLHGLECERRGEGAEGWGAEGCGAKVQRCQMSKRTAKHMPWMVIRIDANGQMAKWSIRKTDRPTESWAKLGLSVHLWAMANKLIQLWEKSE